LSATPQPAEGITYAHKIDKAEAAIDWALPATTLARRIRAFDPFPGATCRVGDETVKLWQADPLPPDPAATATPGTVLNADDQGDGALTVACGEGALRITQVQRPGARRAPVGAWLRQQAVPVGTTLG
jgi:methionyl-tRNA formyltransferase